MFGLALVVAEGRTFRPCSSLPAIIRSLPVFISLKYLRAKSKIREGLPLGGNQVIAALQQYQNLGFYIFTFDFLVQKRHFTRREVHSQILVAVIILRYG
jgi:hypothetical protein